MNWRWIEGIEKVGKEMEKKRNPPFRAVFHNHKWIETSCNGMIHKLFQQLTLTLGIQLMQRFHQKHLSLDSQVWFFSTDEKGQLSSIFFRRFLQIDVVGVSYVLDVLHFMTLNDSWFDSPVQPCKITLMSRPRKDSMKSWLMEEHWNSLLF